MIYNIIMSSRAAIFNDGRYNKSISESIGTPIGNCKMPVLP